MNALVVLIGASVGVGCARSAPPPAVTVVVLAQNCSVGPHCVTGQVDDRYGVPLSEVRCSVRTEEGEVMETRTDDHGVYLIDRLSTPPREVRFVKDGYTSDVVALAPVASGVAARTYATLQQADEANCTCETAAIFRGEPPCPEEKCAAPDIRETPPPARGP